MRPRLIVHNITSMDGRLTLAPGVDLMTGDERWTAMTSGQEDPYEWARVTHRPQVFLEGSGSLLAPADAPLQEAEPEPAPEGEHYLPDEVVHVPGRHWFALVDGAGRVDLQFAEWPDPAWAGWHSLVLTSLAAPAEHLALLRERDIPYLIVGRDRVALGSALALLHERLGVETVVATGGGRLGGALLRQHLVDEIGLELLPWAVGGRGTPMLFDAAPLAADEWPVRLELLGCEPVGEGRIRLRYRVAD